MKNFLNFEKINFQQGIVKTIIVIVIALLILSYFGFDLRKTAEAPTTQSNFSYAKSVVVTVWHYYLEKPVLFVWNFFITYIWSPIIKNVLHVGNGQPLEQNPAVSPTS